MSLHYSSKTPVNSQGITNLYKPPPKEMKASPSNAVAICPRPTTITPTSRKILPGVGVEGGGGVVLPHSPSSTKACFYTDNLQAK